MALEKDAELTDDERNLLIRGLSEWGGPATPTAEIAALLGFSDRPTFYEEAGALADQIRARQPLAPADWRRALLSTEIVFASDLIGSGVDWSITTGIPDEEAIRLLRGVQRKLVHIIARDP